MPIDLSHLRRPLTAALVLGALLLGACNKNPLQVTLSRCPAVAVVANTGSLTQFTGEGRDIEDIALTAHMTHLRNDCDQTDEVNSLISFDVVATRGPAAAQDSFSLPYYVIVLQDNHRIISKKVFEATVDFDPGADRAGVREVVRQYLPDVNRARRYDYEVLIGFHLTPEDAAYNALRVVPQTVPEAS